VLRYLTNFRVVGKPEVIRSSITTRWPGILPLVPSPPPIPGDLNLLLMPGEQSLLRDIA